MAASAAKHSAARNHVTITFFYIYVDSTIRSPETRDTKILLDNHFIYMYCCLEEISQLLGRENTLRNRLPEAQ